ncbi:MAG: GTP cyclohydrolase I FolE [Alphaproteobacteria bacterium]|nr:GTP cyclohydrolase I FolE [Alphaproteobacteria bacterium]
MSRSHPTQTPTRDEAEEAVRVLLRWIGENPEREGLRETPKRFISAFQEFFSGYDESPEDILSHTFDDIDQYERFVLLRGIDFVSHCEHHILPVIGEAHVAYIPSKGVIGISKLARVVEVFAKRLQTQEGMTVNIANVIERTLKPKGVAVMISAEHQCMSIRGVCKPGVKTITTHSTGAFLQNPSLWQDFKDQIQHC